MEYNEVTEYEWCLMGYYIKRLKRIVESNLKKDLNECMKILEEKEIEKILSKISDDNIEIKEKILWILDAQIVEVKKYQ